MTQAPRSLSTRHLLDIPSLTKEDIHLVLERAAVYKSDQHAGRNKLAGKVIMTIFTENSTRTRVSFDMAALRLGASLINWDETISSTQKGETFSDTIAYLGGYKPDAIIVRHHEYNAPSYIASRVDCAVINAGDSYREHPSQALLDAFTVQECKGQLDNLTIAIIGDIAHSRVANSNIALWGKLNSRVHIIAPPHLQPQKVPAHARVFDNIQEGLAGCDVVMPLRLQKERMALADIPDETAYFQTYGLTLERLTAAKSDAIVLHPGPMNRGVEIDDMVADDPRMSRIFQQGANGVPVRMAILDLLLS
jgi:aspartate carbamoyltransferase catalytic subunit